MDKTTFNSIITSNSNSNVMVERVTRVNIVYMVIMVNIVNMVNSVHG